MSERHRERDGVIARQRKSQGPEPAAIDASHQLVEQHQAAEVHGDAFEAMDVGGGQRRQRHGMIGEPHRDRDAHGVDDHRRRIARQQAHTQHAAPSRAGSDAVKQGERHHAERGDHEVDPRAGFLDQEQALAREVAFSRHRT